MSRLTRALLAVALFAFAFAGRAESLRLLKPANGTTLRGGSVVELHWTAAHLPAPAEEWEAFLSIDGGKYYAFRVTPHLDIELQRFTFIVPNVDTNDARILIRTGNEHQETHFETDGSFSIARDPNGEPIAVPLLEPSRHGEAAREGDPDVLAWAEGARNGSGITQQSSATSRPISSLGTITTGETDAPPVLMPAGASVDAPSLASVRHAIPGREAQKAALPPLSTDLLLVCMRRNI